MCVDFKQVIADIQQDEWWSDQQISRAVGVSNNMIYRIRHGRMIEPKHSVGVKLIRLRKKLLKERANEQQQERIAETEDC